jgi:hypothetical protein
MKQSQFTFTQFFALNHAVEEMRKFDHKSK